MSTVTFGRKPVDSPLLKSLLAERAAPRGWDCIEADDECKVLMLEDRGGGLIVGTVAMHGNREAAQRYASTANDALSPHARKFIRYSVIG